MFITHDYSNNYFLCFSAGLKRGSLNEKKTLKIKRKLQSNKWYTFSCEVLWSLYNVGYAEPKLNGRYFSSSKNLDDNKIETRNMYNIVPNYFKVGIYRPKDGAIKRAILFDDFYLESFICN